MAEGLRRPLKKLTHVRDVNNYIRKKILEGRNLSVEEDRSELIKDFLERFTTGPKAGPAEMTPELFAFFLQKLNAHALYETMDNSSFQIVFPTYFPFDVEAEAEKFGFKNLYTQIENGLRRRSNTVGEVKTASAIYAKTEDRNLFDKVAHAATDPEEVRMSNVGRDYETSRSVQLDILRDKAASMYWNYRNMEDFVKTSAFSSDPVRKKVYESIKLSSIRGNKDKTAGLSEFNTFIELIDEISELKKSK
jgi:hypothetical protein